MDPVESELRPRVPCLHLGFPKTATTTLQNRLFARHWGIVNVGKPGYTHSTRTMIDAVLNSGDFDLDSAKRHWRELTKTARDGRTVIMSAEHISSYRGDRGVGEQKIAQRLRAIVGDAKILITARHQIRALESWYLHKMKVSRYADVETWLEERKDLDILMYDYYGLASLYSSLFGRENIGIFLVEELREAPNAYIERLCGFLGIDGDAGKALMRGGHEKVRRSRRMLIYAKLRSSLFPSYALGDLLPQSMRALMHKYLEGGEPANAQLPAQWLKHIENFYRNGNRKLVTDFDVPLERYGYPL